MICQTTDPALVKNLLIASGVFVGLAFVLVVLRHTVRYTPMGLQGVRGVAAALACIALLIAVHASFGGRCVDSKPMGASGDVLGTAALALVIAALAKKS